MTQVVTSVEKNQQIQGVYGQGKSAGKFPFHLGQGMSGEGQRRSGKIAMVKANSIFLL